MSSARKGLGKDPFAEAEGTSTRKLAVVSESSSVDLETIVVALADIQVDDEFNARSEYLEDEILTLAKAIDEQGLLSPVTLRYQPHKKPSYFLVAGFKRLRALATLGVTHVPARLCRAERQVDAYLLNLAENTARSDLRAADVAQRCTWLSEQYQLSGAEIAEHVKLSKAHVNNLMRIMRQLHPDILAAFRAEDPSAQVQRLVKLCSRPLEEQLKLWKQLTGLDRRAERRAEQGAEEPVRPGAGTPEGKGRPTPRVIQKALGALERLPLSDDGWRRGYVEALQWVLGAGSAPAVDANLEVRRGRPVRG